MEILENFMQLISFIIIPLVALAGDLFLVGNTNQI